MLKYSLLACGLLALSACSGSSDPETSTIVSEAETPSSSDTASAVVAEDTATADPRGPAINGLTEVTPSDIAPTFERDTVIELNAIVSRSLETIEEYDDLRREIRKAERQRSEDGENTLSIDDASPLLTPEEALAQMTELKSRSQAALTELQAEAERLKASDEIYNDAILAGMLEFATDVDNEITATLADMHGTQ